MNTFEIYGRLVACKETENFHPFDVKNYDSGWQTTKYKFNVISGTNRFLCEVGGGCWQKAEKNTIQTYSRKTKEKESEPITISWNDRNDPKVIAGVAGYKIFTCNLLDFDEQEEADEETKDKKNHQYLSGVDYAQFVKKLIDSEKYADTVFKIQGTYEFSYSDKNDQYYRNLVVTKIYKQTPGTEEKAEVTIDCVYTADSYEDGENKSVFNCYTSQYFGNLPKDDKYKRNRFVPIVLTVHGEKEGKAWGKILTRFESEPVRQISLIATMVDGAPLETITYEDMGESTKEMIDMQLISLEDAIKDLGGNKIGDRVTEWVIKKPGRRSIKGSETTVYTEEMLHKKPILEEVEKPAEENIDLFDDEDDI